jgi:hypothetical protein
MSVLAVANAHADSVGDARTAAEGAYNDYYRALRSKPGFTQKDSASLASRILAPAQQHLEKAMAEQTRKTLSERHPAHLLKTPLPAQLPPRKAGMVIKEDAPGAPSYQAPSSGPEHPKTVLDGSHVPRELDFSGPSKSPPASK